LTRHQGNGFHLFFCAVKTPVSILAKYKKLSLHPNNTLFVGKVLLRYPELSSTNAYFQEWLSRERPAEGAVVQADHQTQGRGQMGQSWFSPAGKNLTFSTLFYPSFLPPHKSFLLTKVVALATRQAVAEITGENAWIKWPNDIYLNDKKIAGILLQASLQGSRLQYAIAGIGLNVNQTHFPAALTRASSLALLTGRIYDLDDLRNQILAYLERWYLQARAGELTTIDQAFLEHLYLRHQPARFQRPDGTVFTGSIQGVDAVGRLVVQRDQTQESFDLKEVSLLEAVHSDKN
jgi:BirA family biotin operon repressor/biotin-[acetyl-CoA-carboxylase] ligase